MTSVTKLAEDYILQHPSVKDCLKGGLINYSALSRQIATELKLNQKKSFDAILIACRRFRRKLKHEETFEKRIISILKQSKIEVKNKIVAVVLEKDVFHNALLNIEKEAKKTNQIFRIIEGASGITVITSEDLLETLDRHFKNKIIVENMRLAEIIIKSPKEIETTPGTYAHLCSLLGENNINVVETLSCWTDTIFLVAEKDVSKVMELMRF